VVVDGSPVVVGSGGQLGVVASSQQFKDDIKPMEKTSETILALKPVTTATKKRLIPIALRSSDSSQRTLRK
jgi:hypothetical protein